MEWLLEKNIRFMSRAVTVKTALEKYSKQSIGSILWKIRGSRLLSFQTTLFLPLWWLPFYFVSWLHHAAVPTTRVSPWVYLHASFLSLCTLWECIHFMSNPTLTDPARLTIMERALYKSTPTTHSMIKCPRNASTKWSCPRCFNTFRDRQLTILKRSLALDKPEW